MESVSRHKSTPTALSFSIKLYCADLGPSLREPQRSVWRDTILFLSVNKKEKMKGCVFFYETVRILSERDG